MAHLHFPAKRADQMKRAAMCWLAFAWLALCAGAVHAHGVTLKVGHAQSADSALHRDFIATWAAQLEQASAGRFRFQLLPAAAADAAAVLAQLKEGTLDIACVNVAPGSAPETEKFAAAVSGTNASRELWEHMRTNDLARKEFAGLRVLGVAAYKSAEAAGALAVLVMNPAAYKPLTDDLKQLLNAGSGAETSARLGEVLGAGN